MKYNLTFLIGIFLIITTDQLFCQPSDTTISQTISGVRLIEATNSITFAANFYYTANSTNELYARILPTTSNSNYVFTEPQESDPLQTNTSLPVGSISGSLDVGPTGAAIYSIPIDIPPGRNGMKPNLSLSYNSQGSDGMLGLKWSLSGLSSITRVPTNLYNETFIDVVDFDSNDKYALDGQRLMSIGGDQYRTEFESFSKITMYGTSTNPTYFKVETKDGLELYYGNSTDSRFEVQNSSNVYSWLLNQVKDKSGNYYTINYSENNTTGEIHPASIIYSGYGATTGDYTLEFTYQNRSNNIKSWVSGYPLTNSQLLNLITIKYTNTTVGKYQFIYENDTINEIIKFGKNDSRLNSTYINWGVANNTYLETSISAISNLQQRYQGDYNGDGKTDLAIIAGNYCKLYLADSNGALILKSTTTLSGLGSYFYQGDFNGDGRTDLLGFKYLLPNWLPMFLISNGNAFTEMLEPASLGGQVSDYYVGDFNGNGKTDVILNPSSGSYNCLIYEFSFTSGGEVGMSQIGYNNITWGDKGYTLIKEVPFDMNGDGKIELMTLSSTGCRFYGLQDGSSIITEILSSNITNINNANLFGDFNGDGMTDIFTYNQNNEWKVYFSKGNGFEEHPISIFSGFNPDVAVNNFYAEDMNGDGKCDIVDIGKGTNINNPYADFYIGYSNGSDFALYFKDTPLAIEFSPYMLQYDYNHFGDYNGDGVVDYYYDKGSFAKLVNFYRGRSQYFVSSIVNGFGYSTHLNYSPLTSSVYNKGTQTNSYPVICFQAPIYVVESVLQDNQDMISHSTTTYSYSDARLHLMGRGFLGFQKITSLNTTQNVRTIDEYEYHPSYFNPAIKAKSIYSILSDSTNGEIVSKITYLNTTAIWGNNRLFSFVDNSTDTNYLSGVIINRDYTYDSNGNLTSYREDFDDGSFNSTSYSNFSSAGTWLPAKPQTVTISKKHYQDSQTFSSTINYTYYSITGLTNTKSDGLLTTTYAYDSYGNLTSDSISDGSSIRSSHITYDNQNMFPWRTYNALNHMIERTFDYVTGNVLTEKSPNNVETVNTYDDFGNLRTTSIPLLGKYQTITYAWTTGTRPEGAVYSKLTTTDYSPSVKEYYDAFGRILKTETTGFNGSPVFKSNVYNDKGQITNSSTPYRSGDIPLETVYTYDRYGHIVQEESTSGTVLTTYNGKTIQVSTSNGQTSSKTLDSQGNVIQATDNVGSVTYSYKSVGKPSSITANSSTWSMVYDSYGRQTSLTDPNAGTISYRYNKFGELSRQTDARGKIDSMT